MPTSSINRLALQLEDRNLLLEKAVKSISALNRVGVALSSELDIDRLVQLLINISVKGLRVEIGSIFLFDERRERLVVRASSGLPADFDPTLSIAPGESVSGTVASSGQPLLIRHVDGSQGIKPLSRFGFTRRSVLCVPIKMKDRVLGTIELTNRRGEESFSIDDLEMLQSIANQAAVAIENANLYRDVQRSYLETVLALVQAVEEKDQYTRGHSERVTAFSVKIAHAMGLSQRQLRMIEYAGGAPRHRQDRHRPGDHPEERGASRRRSSPWSRTTRWPASASSGRSGFSPRPCRRSRSTTSASTAAATRSASPATR